MGQVLAFAPAGEDDDLRNAADSSVAGAAGLGEVEALRRRLVRLAFDVHDGPMQDLVSMNWRLQSARADAIKDAQRGKAEALAAAFDGLAADLSRVEKGLRALMLSAENSTPRQDSFSVPIDEHVVVFRRQATAHVEVSIMGNVQPRTDSQRIALERVLRESLSNIAKHARAEHVTVTMRGTDELITLEVRDDGCGFESEEQRGIQHIGLRAMGELLRLLDGRLAIDSRDGGPTTITAEIRKWQRTSPVLDYPPSLNAGPPPVHQ